MHAALVFEDAVDAFARHREDDLLVAAHGAFREARDGHLPALLLDVFRVHAEEVAGKEGRFVAARAAADFHDDVLVVFGVGGDEQQLDFLLQPGDALFARGELFAQHLAAVFVALFAQHLFGQLDVVERVHVFLAGSDDFAQVLVFLRQPHVALLVGDHGGVGDERAHFLIAAHQPVQLIEQRVIHSQTCLLPT